MDIDLLFCYQACDSFYKTKLPDLLEHHGLKTCIITGCATNFNADTAIHVAASKNYEVMVVKDGHTAWDRLPLDAQSIITHHNWMWKT